MYLHIKVISALTLNTSPDEALNIKIHDTFTTPIQMVQHCPVAEGTPETANRRANARSWHPHDHTTFSAPVCNKPTTSTQAMPTSTNLSDKHTKYSLQTNQHLGPK